jgi:hypothetical protein
MRTGRYIYVLKCLVSESAAGRDWNLNVLRSQYVGFKVGLDSNVILT